MNYIKHLSSFFETIYSDSRLNPNHVSLYLSLFQFWNLNRFEGPFKIFRSDVMKLSKIGSFNTYHKCMHDLHQFGYIEYIPSYNPFQGSQVNLYNFDTGTGTGTSVNLIQDLYRTNLKNDTGTDTGLEPILKQYKHINNKTIYSDQAKIQNEDPMKPETKNNTAEKTEESDKKGVEPPVSETKPERTQKKAGNQQQSKNSSDEERKIPPALESVMTYFTIKQYPELEARKFFNHFQSNGWKVGGKSPMKDWHAAAQNWMLNYTRFNPPVKPGTTTLTKNKNYGEPL